MFDSSERITAKSLEMIKKIIIFVLGFGLAYFFGKEIIGATKKGFKKTKDKLKEKSNES